MKYLYELRIRRIRRSFAHEGTHVHSAATFAEFFRRFTVGEPREVFLTMCLDVRNRCIGVERTAVGCLTGVEVHPREVFITAITAQAAAIVVAHNHPSNEATPSEEDWAISRRIRLAGELLGIPLLDHVIVTDDSHCSMAENPVWASLTS